MSLPPPAVVNEELSTAAASASRELPFTRCMNCVIDGTTVVTSTSSWLITLGLPLLDNGTNVEEVFGNGDDIHGIVAAKSVAALPDSPLMASTPPPPRVGDGAVAEVAVMNDDNIDDAFTTSPGRPLALPNWLLLFDMITL